MVFSRGLGLLFLGLLVDPVVQASPVSVESQHRHYMAHSQWLEHTAQSRQRRTASSALRIVSRVLRSSGRHHKALTKDGILPAVLRLRVRAHHGAKVVVVHQLLIDHHEVAPPLLALLALHLVLVDGLGRVEVGEVPLEVLVDVIVHPGEAQGRALDTFKDRPVGLQVLHHLDGELLLDLWAWSSWSAGGTGSGSCRE